jgi:hypothetical protein
LFIGRVKCNRELDPRMRSGLIADQDSASIGKTYRAISKTFEPYDDVEAFPRCHFAELFLVVRL